MKKIEYSIYFLMSQYCAPSPISILYIYTGIKSIDDDQKLYFNNEKNELELRDALP